MENPVDHSLDLGLVNFTRHPSNSRYVVFRFADEKRAVSFENELTTRKIWFEKGLEEKKQKKYVLFGIHQNDFNAVQKINFEVEAKHKKHIIPNVYFKWTLLILTFLFVSLAIFGYCKRNESTSSINKSNDWNNVSTKN
jgi:hypothetical protein